MIPKSKEEAVKTAREKARENMLKYGSWAYSTVLALQDTFGLKDEALLKASGALTGGIGGLADTCGSMIGSTLVLGSVCGKGRQDADDEKGLKKLFDSVRGAADYYIWFKGERDGVNCREIVTRHGNGTFYDFGKPDEAKIAREKGVFDKCVELVQDNVAEAAEILWDELYPEN